MSVDLPARLAVLDAWLARQLPQTHRVLNPGASDAELDRLEALLGEAVPGLTLPADFRTLYRWHDGQQESVETTEPGVFVLLFMTLAEVAQLWGQGRATLQADPALNERMSGQVSHPPLHVQAQFLHLGWLPFCRDDDRNTLGLDLQPGPLGGWGQVITSGQDEDHKFVLAPSLADFIDEYVRRLEAGRVRVYQPDGDLYPDDPFTMELQAASGEFMESRVFLADLFPGFGASPVP